MHCEQMTEWMSEALDRRLDDRRQGQLDEHMAACADCRREWEALQQTVSLLRTVAPVAPSPGLGARVRERLERKSAPVMTRYIFARPEVRVALAAGVVLMVCMFSVLHEKGGRRQENAPAQPNPPAAESALKREAAPKPTERLEVPVVAVRRRTVADRSLRSPAARRNVAGEPAFGKEAAAGESKGRIWSAEPPAERFDALSEGQTGSAASGPTAAASRPSAPRAQVVAEPMDRVDAARASAPLASAATEAHTEPRAELADTPPRTKKAVGDQRLAALPTPIRLVMRGIDEKAVLRALKAPRRKDEFAQRPLNQRLDKMKAVSVSKAESPDIEHTADGQTQIVAHIARADLPAVLAQLHKLHAAKAEADMQPPSAADALAETTGDPVTLEITLLPAGR